MVRTAINLYSVRELDESVEEILDRVADAGYDGVQFSGGRTWGEAGPEKIREKLDETGLEVTGAHVGIDELEDDQEATVEAYRTLGCDSVVVPYLDATEFESTDAVDQTIDRLQLLQDQLEDYNIELHYHNHDHEFVDLGEHTGFDRLIDGTSEIGFELDVGWAAAGGSDPVELLDRIGERGPLVHMKDVDLDTNTPVEIGTGDVDMEACARAASEAGADWLIYEHDFPSNPTVSIERGAEALSLLS
ncbi:sugar phosphate isomerase/epimerase family protein [Halomicrobium urmianum]|uniref:sugar phosphate isomerase/epimerase family protein n=1 Tax=Halomicrobium urmianum TaxID=1586233 RepID=UPI001CD9AB8C|nr:sugar phosphate isomerase/epimerase [Halomicrobium urmianum]